MDFSTPLSRFRWVARFEGISFLVLLFIAMPLKYGFDWPYAVKYIGWAHGVLFVWYVIALVEIWQNARWGFWKAALAFLMSLLPFGTFWFERKYLTS